ncbi:DUF6221 family protein [Streptomyces sp. NPDC056242]|uniref:DUF6221 family protein n=1 Tax=Streptomyces sp. NPDC056242 TaxID=3345760 RepID=UPI0035D7D2F1
MDDLVQWLGEQLDEDARVARRAGDSFRQIGETGVIVATDGDRAEECASANWAGIAEHIVKHDPARVLREIDAKRQLLRKVFEYEAMIDSEWGCSHDADAIRTGLCSETQPNDVEALRLLALPYADRPGYREEWRP